jgi:hypothetical protein
MVVTGFMAADQVLAISLGSSLACVNSAGLEDFVHNHADAIASIDMFVVRTISFGFCMDFSSFGSHAASFCGWV